MFVDWLNEKNYLILNPRLPKTFLTICSQIEGSKFFDSHIWLATSGSTDLKLVALKKTAFLASAKAVNEHLNVNSEDCWANPLPTFHVGGLSIFCRAFLSKSKVVPFEEKWNLHAFYHFLKEHRCTITALVPTQLYDLTSSGLKAPSHLRAVIIGGGALDKSLYIRARELDWPILPSFGMTECCSQVATASIESFNERSLPKMQILPHVEIELDDNNLLKLKSPALLSAYGIISGNEVLIQQPVKEGWFLTRDRGEVEDGFLKILGRLDDFIKIGGENVEMIRLESILNAIKLKECPLVDLALIAVPDERLGHTVHLATTGECRSIVKLFNEEVLPFERIRKVHVFNELPRSPLKKLLRKELENLIKVTNNKAQKVQ